MKDTIKDVIERCQVNTVEEVTKLLEETAERGHTKIASLLELKPWTEWNSFIMNQIPNAIKWYPTVTSIIKDNNGEVIAKIIDKEYINPETFTHEALDRNIYKLEEDYSSDKVKRFVFVEINPAPPVDEEQLYLDKIKNKVELNEDELAMLAYGEIGYIEDESSSGEGRWSKYVQTIVKLKDEYVAINWNKGLTEQQENSFFDQPYIVKKKVEIVTIEQVSWI